LGNFPQKFDSRTAKTAETIRTRGAIWKIQIELVLSIINLAQAVAHQKNHAQLKGAKKKIMPKLPSAPQKNMICPLVPTSSLPTMTHVCDEFTT